jgi:glycine/D-amino acid oxidase-like deaminating enzyme
VATEKLTRDAKPDVLVIGMGISGAMVCQALASAGASVIAVDRRGPLRGSTAATSSLVQFEIDEPLSLLAARIGKSNAERAWRRSRLAIDNLKARIGELSIDCDLAERSSLYLAGTILHLMDCARRRRPDAQPACMRSIDARRAGGALRHQARRRPAQRRQPGAQPAPARCGFASRRSRPRSPLLCSGRGDGPESQWQHDMDMVPGDRHRVVSTWPIATKPQPRKLWPGESPIWEASEP